MDGEHQNDHCFCQIPSTSEDKVIYTVEHTRSICWNIDWEQQQYEKRVTTHTYQQFESIIPVHPCIPPRRPLESYRIQLYDSQMAEARINMNDECNTSWNNKNDTAQ
jgi:hypothetical protein